MDVVNFIQVVTLPSLDIDIKNDPYDVVFAVPKTVDHAVLFSPCSHR